jgi:hypothetical protein
MSAFMLLRKYGLQKTSDSIVNIIWDSNNDWILERRDGKSFVAELMFDSYINPLITILVFKRTEFGYFYPDSIRNVILLKDNVDADSFRRLRVRLKLGKTIEQKVL